MKTILVDPSRCLQCSNCWVACKDEHCGNDWSPISAPQGEDQWWIRVEETEVASGAHMKLHRVPILCQHCKEAPCMAAAPDAVYRRDDGLVVIDPKQARGRQEIFEACPYGVVYYNAELDLPQKCTGCAHLLDAGYQAPRCVTACPNDALAFVDEGDLAPENMYAPLEVFHPEFETQPSVAYVRLPRIFVAGELATQDETGCIEDALVTAWHQVTGDVYEGYSSTFGDFHIDVEAPGFYSVEFFAEGFKRKTITDIDLRESRSLGVVKLWPRLTNC
ncbi:MAG: oxidoreductase [Eggerthellaceae bacterium]|jgi:Fe-S-cluster-containing dehydrogenase component|nr:oxidoreductase [Eggerthellaceae bacterium]